MQRVSEAPGSNLVIKRAIIFAGFLRDTMKITEYYFKGQDRFFLIRHQQNTLQ